MLKPTDVTSYRSCVMRAAFLAQDRPDLGEAVKSLSQQMARPSRSSWEDLKRLGRYLLGRPSVAVRYAQQTRPAELTILVDSDHAADKISRKSTTGAVQKLGMHPVKFASVLQTSVSLNVSESEYYALTYGGAHGLGLQSHMRDLGLEFSLTLQSDSSAAKSFASRRGLGRQRHVQTRYLWIQNMVATSAFRILKVKGTENQSDILTKAIDRSTLDRHMRSLNVVIRDPSQYQKRTGRIVLKAYHGRTLRPGDVGA